MVRPIVSVSILVVLGACATPLEIYYKPGASVSRMQTDTTRCDVAALRDAPVANQVRQEPGYFIPGVRRCNGAGQCWTEGGYWRQGRVYTVDVNAPLRQRVTDQCMGAKGYQRTKVPACSQSVIDAAPPMATQTLPRLTPNSCVIKNEGGSWQIVNAP
jgi:hypothetical protein